MESTGTVAYEKMAAAREGRTHGTGRARMPSQGGRRVPLYATGFGVFLCVASVYVLSGPGRIDMIDGQLRFEVALNWFQTQEPVLRDPVLRYFGIQGQNAEIYSRYGSGASAAALPLLALASLGGEASPDFQRFVFSLTTPLLSALACSVLVLFCLRLGVRPRHALVCACVVAFASFAWPSAVSSFPNGQFAVFLLLSLWLGHQAAVRKSFVRAAAAGGVLSLLIAYDEYLVCLVPAAGVVTVTSSLWPGLRERVAGPRRWWAWLGAAWHEGSLQRYALFVAGASVGVACFLAFNDLRFGSMLRSGKAENLPLRHSLLGDPVAGFIGLLVSPGKGILWFSPPLFLCFLGFPSLLRRERSLGLALIFSSLTLLLVLSPVAFFGGDWCWGPRYLAVLVPAWGLALPYVLGDERWLPLSVALVSVGLVVQLLGISVDHQRYFFEQGLADFFWAEDPWYYFKGSQLLARPAELLDLLRGVPTTATLFNNAPDPLSLTYCTFGSPMPRDPAWIRQFQLYFLPRPWPLWMSSDVLARTPPISVSAWVAGSCVAFVSGAALIGVGIRRWAIPRAPRS